MPALAKMKDNEFELAICDPPYGIGMDGQNEDKKHGFRGYEHKGWDKTAPQEEYFDTLFRISKNQIIWGANHFISKMPKDSSCWIMWNKCQRDFSFADGELAWASFKKAVRIFDFSRGEALKEKKDFGERHHPTQKPVQLYKWLLQNYAKEGDKILDTHLGSGSIALACWDLCFDLTAYEIDKDYYDGALARLERHKSQGQLF